MTKWVDKLDDVQVLLSQGVSLEQIGDKYNVTKQRIYQILTKYGIQTPAKTKKNFLKDKGPQVYWLNRMLITKKFPKEERMLILEKLIPPSHCPILGIKLNYDGVEHSGWSHNDDSPSIDRIDSSKEYTADNIQVISWRANRIKNDATPEELRKIADYMSNLT